MADYNYISINNIPFKKVIDREKTEYFDLNGTLVDIDAIEKPQTNQDLDLLTSDDSDTITFLSKLIKESLFLDSEEEYSVLSAYVLLSYTYAMFEKVPYLWFNAPKGSGKTTALKCLRNLVRKPIYASSYTGSSLYRVIDSDSPTLILDEVEELKQRSKATETIIKILNSGYDKSGTVMLTEKFNSVTFKTYSVKILAGINELFDTIQDRCIKIKLKKASTSIGNKNIIENSKEKILELLEIKISGQISELNKIIKNPGQLNLSDKFVNRSFDKWLPILSITKAFGTDDLFESVKIYAESEIDELLQDEKNSKENLTKSIIDEFIRENAGSQDLLIDKQYYFKTTKLIDYFEKHQPHKIFRDQQEFTKYLQNFNIKTDRRRFNKNITSFYTFREQDFKSLMPSKQEKKDS